MTKRLFYNSASSMVLYGVNIAIAFLLSPVIIRALGNRDYGIWEILNSFCGYFNILELGIGPAIIRYVARETAFENWDALNRIFNSAFWGLVLVGFFSLAGMCFAALVPETLLNLQQGEVPALPMLCLLVGLNLLLQFIGTLFVAFLMGRQEYLFLNLFRSIFYVLQAFLVFLALTRWEGSKLIWIAMISIAGNLFQYAVLCGITFRRQTSLSFRLKWFSYSTMKELYSFGVKSALLMVSDRVQRQSMPIIIGQTIGAAFVVYYVIPKRLVDYAKDFVMSLGFPLMPYFSSLDATRLPGERMREWIPISRALSFITIPAGISIMILGDLFINIWLGPEYAEKGKWVILSLSASFLITGLLSNSSRVLIAANLHGQPAKKVLIISAGSIGFAIPATIWLGVNGAAFVIMIADLLACWVFWEAASKYVGIKFSEHLNATIRPIAVPTVFLTAGLVSGRVLTMNSPGYIDLGMAFIISLILYLVSGWHFCLKPPEKEYMRFRIKSYASRTLF